MDSENRDTAQIAHRVLTEHFKFSDVMVLTDLSKAQMIESFHYLKRLAENFEYTKKNLHELVQQLVSLEDEAKNL